MISIVDVDQTCFVGSVYQTCLGGSEYFSVRLCMLLSVVYVSTVSSETLDEFDAVSCLATIGVAFQAMLIHCPGMTIFGHVTLSL